MDTLDLILTKALILLIVSSERRNLVLEVSANFLERVGAVIQSEIKTLFGAGSILEFFKSSLNLFSVHFNFLVLSEEGVIIGGGHEGGRVCRVGGIVWIEEGELMWRSVALEEINAIIV